MIVFALLVLFLQAGAAPVGVALPAASMEQCHRAAAVVPQQFVGKTVATKNADTGEVERKLVTHATLVCVEVPEEYQASVPEKDLPPGGMATETQD